MSNVEWDSKTVIGQKAKAAKVAKNASDLNGASHAMSACLLKFILLSVFCSCEFFLKVDCDLCLIEIGSSGWCGRRNRKEDNHRNKQGASR
jgi:hypothetical protein